MSYDRTLCLALRDAALAQSQRGREERIQAVRERLVLLRDNVPYAFPDWELTGDHVLDACEVLGFLDGDRRWTASVLKGWEAVQATDRYENSRRPECHARPKRVWRWK